jgi:hypothetical protein
MKTASSFTPAERIESLKAAILGASSAGLFSLTLWFTNRLLQANSPLVLADWLSSLADGAVVAAWAIAGLSGALFALTYRYAIRHDQNPQLKAGVVLAFTLVRGLAVVDVPTAIAQHFWPWLVSCGESLLIFGGCAIVLNLAFRQKWVKPFGAD